MNNSSKDDSVETAKSYGANEETTVDLFNRLRFPPETDMQQKIEIVRLQFEREQLEVEKSKAIAEQRFWTKNFGASITAVISLAAILVSLSQVWVAKIQKDKELALAQSQKEKEQEAAWLQQERTWRLDMAKFVTDHGDKLFGKDRGQRELITSVMVTTFPRDYSEQLLERIETVTKSHEAKEQYQSIRRTILPKIRTDDLDVARSSSCQCTSVTGGGSKISCPPNSIAVCTLREGTCVTYCASVSAQ